MESEKLTSTIRRPGLVTYENHVELLFNLLCHFYTEKTAAEALKTISSRIVTEVDSSGYNHYAKLICVRSILGHISADPVARLGESLEPLTKEEAFCILLRDRYNFSCREISSVFGISEGSIRTRLERLRKQLAPHLGITLLPKSAIKEHPCFGLQDTLEDTPEGVLSQEVLEKTKNCPKCTQFFELKHKSKEFLAKEKVATLPDAHKKFQENPIVLKEGRRWVINWSIAPWYFKALFEGFLATCLVLGVVFSIPRIKQVYEFWIEKRLDLYTIAELTSAGSSDETARENTLPQKASEEQEATSKNKDADEDLEIATETEFGRGYEKPTSDKIYRILIKTDAPDSLQPKILKALKDVAYQPEDKENAEGAQLPGGIMFSVYVAIKDHNRTLQQLERIAGKENVKQIITRSRRDRGVTGKTHLKIWLQRI